MYGLSKLWEAVWQEAKSCRVWYLAGNPKVRDISTFPHPATNTVLLSAGDVKKVTKGKVAVFTNPIDIAQTETKGTVLIKNADDMLNFTRGEEKHMEKVCEVKTHRCGSLNLGPRFSRNWPTRE
jgi:hypothetical protein